MNLSERLKGSPFLPVSDNNQKAPAPIELVIGIDYGTRYTKVAVGNGRLRQVWQDDKGLRLIPSLVFVASDGTVVSYPDRPPAGCEKIEYLKMLLADPQADVFRSTRTSVNGKPIREVVRPLAAAFISGVIARVQKSIIEKRPDLLSRGTTWIVNLGAPAAHCDFNLTAFQEVAAVAFEWAAKGQTTRLKVDQLISTYRETLRTLDFASSPTSVVPELTATIHEFVKDPNRADNLYALVDIGGGTLDGTIFRINRTGEGAPLIIHAANVATLGTIAISRTMLAEIYSKLPDYIESPLLSPDKVPSIALPLSEELAFRDQQSVYNEVQNLVASVIWKTKKQLYGQLFSPRTDITEKELPALRVFLSGGGSGSGWYKSCVGNIYWDRNLHTWGLTGILVETVAAPSDYKQLDYARFIIALGLADFSTALAEARLPHQMNDATPLPSAKIPSMVTKDEV